MRHRNYYYSFDIETNQETGALYLWCVSRCENWRELVDDPTQAPIYFEELGYNWESFFRWLDKIPLKSTIFIHNMEFDFNAILANCPNFAERYKINNESSIITGYHSFIRICCERFKILDSSKITLMSIFGLRELLGIPKLEEEYNGLVTTNSIKYCFRDTEIAIRGVAYFCNAYGVKSIPLTSTGYNKKAINKHVNRLHREDACLRNDKLLSYEKDERFKELVRKEYNGGVCYTNMFYGGSIVKAQSGDIGSSYPTAMMGFLYPEVSRFSTVEMSEPLKKEILEKFRTLEPKKAFETGTLLECLGFGYRFKGFLAKITIKGKMDLHIFKNKNYFPLISMTRRRKSKNNEIQGIKINQFYKLKTCFNKLLYMEDGDEIEIAVNEYDLYMILKCYDIENINIDYGYIYNMSISPFLIDTIKTFLNDKNQCKTKNTDSNAWNNTAFYNLFTIATDQQNKQLYNFVYGRTKACVNGCYGINVEDKEKEKYIIADGNNISVLVDNTPKKNKSPYNELMGGYVSCFGRWQLFVAFMGIVENGGVNYYSDTDSVKVGNIEIETVIKYYNERFSKHWEKLEKRIPGFERPTKYGIGELDAEPFNNKKWFDFISIGSKNYLCYDDGKIKGTISGVRHCSDIFQKLLDKEKSFSKMVKKYYHYGLVIKDNKLVPNYSKLGTPCENGNTCVILQNADFSLMNNDATGKINKIVANNLFNNFSKCYERKEIIINGN